MAANKVRARHDTEIDNLDVSGPQESGVLPIIRQLKAGFEGAVSLPTAPRRSIDRIRELRKSITKREKHILEQQEALDKLEQALKKALDFRKDIDQHSRMLDREQKLEKEVERLQTEISNLTGERDLAQRTVHDLLDKQQEIGFKSLGCGGWIPEEESKIRTELESLKRHMKALSQSIAIHTLPTRLMFAEEEDWKEYVSLVKQVLWWEDGDHPLQDMNNTKSAAVLLNAAKHYAKEFTKSPLSCLIKSEKSVEANMKMEDTFVRAAHFAFNLWTRKTELKCLTLEDLITYQSDDPSLVLHPLVLCDEGDEHKYDSRDIVLVVHPLVFVCGTDDGDRYEETRIWMPAEVWFSPKEDRNEGLEDSV